ncbi:hypothetical protein [Psychroserpens sp. MEBiC05023]
MPTQQAIHEHVAKHMTKTNYRIIIGILSILISVLFLYSEIPTYFEQRGNKDKLWFYWLTAELHAGGWIIGNLLWLSGILLVLKNKKAQLIYNLFGISIIAECIIRIINYDKGLFSEYLLMFQIGLGIFAVYISNSEKWKSRLNWNTLIGKNNWIFNIIIAILIIGIPRWIFKGHNLW